MSEMYEPWVEKCLTCQHCYRRQDDDDILYCRKRKGKCEYKEYQKKDKRSRRAGEQDEVKRK